MFPLQNLNKRRKSGKITVKQPERCTHLGNSHNGSLMANKEDALNYDLSARLRGRWHNRLVSSSEHPGSLSAEGGQERLDIGMIKMNYIGTRSARRLRVPL